MITRVQSTSNGNAVAANQLALTFGSNTTVGNYVLVGININTTALQAATILETAYVSVCTRFIENVTGPSDIFMILARVLTAGTALTVDPPSSTVAVTAAVAAEYSANHLELDQGPSGGTGLGTALASGTLTSPYQDTLFVGLLGQRLQAATPNTSWASAPTNSFSIVAQTSSTVNGANLDRSMAFLERITTGSNPGSISAGCTSSINAQWAGALFTLHENLSSSVY